MKVPGSVVEQAAYDFVGTGWKTKIIPGGVLYTSKDKLRSVRIGQKYGKSKQQGTVVREANFERVDKNGKLISNYHVVIE